MPSEIEKKYRLSQPEQAALVERLRVSGAEQEGDVDFEVNTLYAGNSIDLTRTVLRLRRTQQKCVLTFKERFASDSAIKHNREEETVVEDADAMHAILTSLGFAPTLLYEKRRTTWHLNNAEIVIDELPFGLFVEIEAEEQSIVEVEKILGLENAASEHKTYPDLTREYCIKRSEMIEARF